MVIGVVCGEALEPPVAGWGLGPREAGAYNGGLALEGGHRVRSRWLRAAGWLATTSSCARIQSAYD